MDQIPEPQIHSTQNGFSYYVPIKKGRRRFFSIYDQNQQLVPWSDVKTTLTNTEPPDEIPTEINFEREFWRPVLFAGQAAEHFGHMLTASLGRLWALEELPKRTIIYYMTRRRPQQSHGLETILRVFNIPNPVHISWGNVSSRHFYTAPELYGERYEGRANSQFTDWVHRQLKPYRVPTKSGKKLYVTRSCLSALEGRFACEDTLEENLTHNGFEIYAPEKHSLEDQFIKYSEAETIIFAEGSAQHVHAFVKKPEQTVVNIARRKYLEPLLLNQPLAFDPTPVHWIEAIIAFYRPEHRRANLGVALLDFDVLREQLIKSGALPKNCIWRNPTATETRDSLYKGLENGERILDEMEYKLFLQARREHH